jgi:sporulation protein YlmC with PRC-barrel domain
MEVAMPHRLVPSDHVEGAAVYGRDGKKIGTIERLMLDKQNGTVAYAVVQSGGLMAIERHHYPVEWSSLRFDANRKGYETSATLDELRSGPSELDGDDFDWGNRSQSYSHPQYWTV